MKSITSVRVNECSLLYRSGQFSCGNSIKSQTTRFASTGKTKGLKIEDIETIAGKLNIRHLDDWYRVDPYETGHRNQISLPRVLSEKYPQHNWLPWKFEHCTVPKGYWMKEDAHRLYFDWAAKQLGVQKMEDWYSIEAQKLATLKSGSTVLVHFGGSLVKALQSVYPDFEWKVDKFGNKPSGWWFDMDNQKLFVEQTAKKLGIQQLDDWYHVGVVKFQNVGGARLLNMYNGSLSQILMTFYPQHKWILWKFGKCPANFWDSMDNRRAYFDDLAKELGIQNPEDWYQVRYNQLLKLKRHYVLIQKFNNSLYLALSQTYPEVNWVPWYFEKAPKLSVWNDPRLTKQLIYEAAEKLHINVLEDWYRVSRKQLEDLKMRALLDYYGGLYNLLRLAYPSHSWDIQKFGKSNAKKSSQRWLLLMLSELFPKQEIIEDYMHPEMMFPSTKRKMQLDAFIPAYNLAFEFHGLQHYQDIGYFSPQARYQMRDEEKKTACAARKITLVEVPFWWDRTQESLAATIKAIRPDIPLPDVGPATPIATEFTGQTTLVTSVNFKTKKEIST